MPWPISLYQGPLSLPMSMPAAFQSSSSAACVPERSPREMKGASLALMAFNASVTSLMVLIPAGSLLGPTKMKSLYITGYRFRPAPSAMNFSSCGLACTNSTSASPRRPVSRAWPVPCATTFTSMPVLALNSGRIWPNRPESCVDVVEATTIDLSCACAGVAASMAMVAARTNRRRVGIMFFSLFRTALEKSGQKRKRSNEQLTGDESAGLGAARSAKESIGRAALDHPAAMHEHDFAGESLGLVQIVRRYHHFDAARDDRANDIFDRFGRSRVEACRRLVEQENLRFLGQSA